MKSRESRKIDHIRYALQLGDGPCATGFSDVQILHRCLPQVNRSAGSLSTHLPGIGTLPHPLLLNAMTGGAGEVKAINASLALVARETHSAMAVGSQYGALVQKSHTDSFRIVRKINPQGIIFANVSPLATPEMALEAIDMIGAQGLQIHLNAAQELAMEEGDRDFSSWLDHIAAICAVSPVPVIVKETGCGMLAEDAKALLAAGVKILDTGGAGGTNFPAIEQLRHPGANSELSRWGIPSALSLLEVVSVTGWQEGVVASGGIRTALDIVKAQVLGANMVGMAGNLLHLVQKESPQKAIQWINNTLESVKDFYTLTGCTQAGALQTVRYYLSGNLAAAVAARSGRNQQD